MRAQLSFVKDVLFGYIRNHLKDFIQQNADQEWINEFPRENLESEILHLMHQDSKVSWLKNFQGIMWNYGYENNTLKGQVYRDVESNFKSWSQKFTLGIYSSGSITKIAIQVL